MEALRRNTEPAAPSSIGRLPGTFLAAIHRCASGSHQASEAYRALLAARGLVGSMGRRSNPHDDANAESFVKTLNVEADYPMAYESFEDANAHIPHFIDDVHNRRRQHSGSAA
jgi:putative transposase